MKYLLIFAACFVAVFAQTPSQKLENTLNGLRDNFPCGFPDMGVPPLAPLLGDYFNLYSKKFILKINGSISDFIVENLDSYELQEVSLNVLTLKLNINMNLKHFRARGDYYLESFVISWLKLKGRGTFDISFADLSVRVYARVGMVDGRLCLMDLDVQIALRDMKSKLTGIIGPISSLVASSIFDKLMIEYVADNQEALSENIIEMVSPAINAQLETMGVSELLQLLQSPPEMEPCVPPNY